MTKYIVLARDADADAAEDGWKAVSIVNARSAKAAVSIVLANGEAFKERHFVAVPERSFQPVKVTTETQIKIKFS